MSDTMLIAKLASLLEEEDPFISEIILETVKDVEEHDISVEAHARKLERRLDYELQRMGDERP